MGIFSLLLLFTSCYAEASGKDAVLVVLSGEQDVYQALLKSVERTLAGASPNVELRVKTVAALKQSRERHNDARLVIPVGSAAAAYVAALRVRAPVLNALIPLSVFEKLRIDWGETDHRRYSALVLDQPLDRRLDLLQLALPSKRRIGVILGPQSSLHAAELLDAMRRRDLYLQIENVPISSELPMVLNRVLDQNDVLLAIADNVVFNHRTIQNLLLTTYRKRIPVIGFSNAHVKAGALMAVYSSPTQIGDQLAEMIVEMQREGDWRLPPHQGPRYFHVAINHHVARSMDIAILDEASLRNQLKMTAHNDQ